MAEKEQVKWRKAGSIKLDGDKLPILNADDPSDILWENRQIPNSTRYWGALKFTLTMAFLFSFTMISQLKGAVSQRIATSRYTLTNCKTLYEEYTDE